MDIAVPNVYVHVLTRLFSSGAEEHRRLRWAVAQVEK
jgi:hypothetical protein